MNPRLKEALLPAGRRERRMPTGIGRGLRMGIDFQRGEAKLYLGLYEVELNRHFRKLARPSYRSFDIGGQYGYDALVLAKLTGSDVVTVECEEALCLEIRANAAANPGLASLIRVENAFAGTRGLTLDALAACTFMPDFIKVDIEGGEGDLLESAPAVLAHGPNAVIEVHSVDVETRSVGLLRENGYQLEIVNPRRWMPDHRPIPHNRWIIATRAGW